MTQNEVKIIENAVLDCTEAYVDARLSVLDFVKTQIGVVQSYTERNRKYYHTVKCNATSRTSGIIYTNVLSVGNIPFPANSVVFLIAPNAQFSNQFILGKLDDTPCSIRGGTININDRFIVDANGNVSIKGGSININNRFVVDANGNLNINNRFLVDANGNMTATSGTIAGFSINSNNLQRGSCIFSEYHIGCGYAGSGIINMVGGNGNAYVQISNSGSATSNISGIRIYQDGHISSSLGTGWSTKYFKNIPDQEIYADSQGYLHFAG